MLTRLSFSAAVAALLVTVAAAPALGAAPKLKAKASILREAAGVRLQVRVTSKRRFTADTRPRSVKVTAGDVTYKLKKKSSKAKSSTWRTKLQSGAAAQALEALAG